MVSMSQPVIATPAIPGMVAIVLLMPTNTAEWRGATSSQFGAKPANPQYDQFHAEVSTLIGSYLKDHPGALLLNAHYDNQDDTTDDRWFLLDKKAGKFTGEIVEINFGSNG